MKAGSACAVPFFLVATLSVGGGGGGQTWQSCEKVSLSSTV
jgi:hypothetical protein